MTADDGAGARTRVFVIHPALKGAKGLDPELALAEGIGLTQAIDLDLVGGIVVPLAKREAATLLGSGKVAELAERFADAVDVVVVNGALSPIQQRNLERAWKVKVLDRTGLILEIFGERAQTREGVLQVELAHLTYQKSRLVRSWTHLERQRGGAGFMGGPGETQIEADRRVIDETIQRLKKALEQTVRTRQLHRAARKRAPYPVVALVGYTNAGKSTLFNRLTHAEVLAEDMLFATLDPTMRKLMLPSGRFCILSDTVGFISDLPTQLVAAFRATLEEVLEADLIVHVRDIAHPQSAHQNQDVLAVMRSLGVTEERFETMIEARNKIDLVAPEEQPGVARLPDIHGISAVTGMGCVGLVAEIEARIYPRKFLIDLELGHGDGRAIAWLHAHAEVKAREDTETGVQLRVEVTEKEFFQFQKEHAGRGVVVGKQELAAQ